jgi:small subunit ribosomal protein S4
MLKLRRFYGNIGKRKFKRLFKKPALDSNALGRSFAYFLESRLDVILYRSNFFNSIFAARQAINHNKIYVNGNNVTKPSFTVFINDIVTVSQISDFYKHFKQKLQNNKILTNYPSYLEINYKLGMIVLLKMPFNKEVPFPFFMNLDNLTHGFLK